MPTRSRGKEDDEVAYESEFEMFTAAPYNSSSNS